INLGSSTLYHLIGPFYNISRNFKIFNHKIILMKHYMNQVYVVEESLEDLVPSSYNPANSISLRQLSDQDFFSDAKETHSFMQLWFNNTEKGKRRCRIVYSMDSAIHAKIQETKEEKSFVIPCLKRKKEKM